MTAVAVLGAGAWGTAIAGHLAARAAVRSGVTLWARDGAQADAIGRARENLRYLPGIALPSDVRVTADLAHVLCADLLVAAVPVGALPGLAQSLAAAGARAPLVWLSKGFVDAPALPAGVGLAHQLIAPRWPAPVGIASGPSFAVEVARGLPTALTVAATDPALAADVARLLRGDALRAYESDDIAGVEVGGAIKNVLAIAAGASDGLGFGHNARAALITRGLAETGRLLAAMGGNRETLMGLAGLGDLVLTCTGDLSRNRRVGLGLAQGRTLAAILAELGHVAEGVRAARAARALAAHHGIEMPICDAVDRVLHEGMPPRVAVLGLLRREPRVEGA
jgi:glycerol-3-phosphate dehydrogenase (NAD(P)+)